jgi:hypothetical protein
MPGTGVRGAVVQHQTRSGKALLPVVKIRSAAFAAPETSGRCPVSLLRSAGGASMPMRSAGTRAAAEGLGGQGLSPNRRTRDDRSQPWSSPFRSWLGRRSVLQAPGGGRLRNARAPKATAGHLANQFCLEGMVSVARAICLAVGHLQRDKDMPRTSVMGQNDSITRVATVTTIAVRKALTRGRGNV